MREVSAGRAVLQSGSPRGISVPEAATNPFGLPLQRAAERFVRQSLGLGDALPRTLVAQDRTVLKRAREYSVDESRSAIPGQGGDTKLMALHLLSGGKRTKRCPFVGPRSDKAAHP